MGEHIAGPDPHRFVVGHINRGKMVEWTMFLAQLVDDFLRARATGDAVTFAEVIFRQRPSASARDAGDDDISAVDGHEFNSPSFLRAD